MDFLKINLIIFVITLLSQVFFKSLLAISLIASITYIFAPRGIKDKLDKYFSFEKAQNLSNILFSKIFFFVKKGVDKIDEESK